ncbi:hypothetical protein E4U54_005608 [Claviceps lovelessii]|nr:hypothetical protein E4U54_005608 [Claviceps lovelessii]
MPYNSLLAISTTAGFATSWSDLEVGDSRRVKSQYISDQLALGGLWSSRYARFDSSIAPGQVIDQTPFGLYADSPESRTPGHHEMSVQDPDWWGARDPHKGGSERRKLDWTPRRSSGHVSSPHSHTHARRPGQAHLS